MDPYPPPSMTLSPQSPATGSGSASNAVFRPRRSDDWNEYRDLIEQLYRNDQLKLRDVKRIMERQHNFIASEKQYKDRLAAWNVRKNIKAAEVQVLIRKKQKRAARGKQTAFRRAGHEVDQKRLTRFVRRYGQAWVEKPRNKDAELASPEPKTPSDMSCYTPEPDEVEAATPVSPPDLHSPTTETPPFPVNYDPNNLSTMPDLVIGDDQPYQHAHAHAQAQAHQHAMSLPPHSQSHSHSNPPPRRPYHPSELASPHPITHTHHTHPYTHTHPSVHSIIHSTSHQHPITLSPVHQPVHHQPVHHPVVTSVPPAPATHAPAQNSDIDAPGELETHSDDWNRLDTFQTRLEGLHVRLERSMSKWAQAQDPNAEISHHEGLGL